MTKTQFKNALNIITTIGREAEASILGESGEEHPTHFTLWTYPHDSIERSKDFIYISNDENQPFDDEDEEMIKQGEIIIDDVATFNGKYAVDYQAVNIFEALEDSILNQLVTQGLIRLDVE